MCVYEYLFVHEYVEMFMYDMYIPVVRRMFTGMIPALGDRGAKSGTIAR